MSLPGKGDNMKRFLALALAIALSALPIGAGTIKPPKGFAGKLWASTLALYGTKDGTSQFLCTAEPIEKITEGYRLLSAGHCVQDVPSDIQFSVAEKIGGPRTVVQVVKAQESSDADFAIFDLITTKNYPVFAVGDESDARIGDHTINPNFALGLGEQLSPGTVSSLPLQKSKYCDSDDGCVGDFLVQEYAGPGASGSAVILERTHKIIGILVMEIADEKIGFIVEPISKLTKFLAGPNQTHPADEDASNNVPAGITIPVDVYAAQFGATHPFMLTVKGPNPKFTQGGYNFSVDTDGFELSDDYYYNVPVFIQAENDGTYTLVSTKDGVSVPVVVVSKGA